MKENCQLKLKEREEKKNETTTTTMMTTAKHHTKYSKENKKQRNKATYKSFRSQLKVLLRFPNVLFKCIKLNGNFEHGQSWNMYRSMYACMGVCVNIDKFFSKKNCSSPKRNNVISTFGNTYRIEKRKEKKRKPRVNK